MCLLDCMLNFVIEKCGCVGVEMLDEARSGKKKMITIISSQIVNFNVACVFKSALIFS